MATVEKLEQAKLFTLVEVEAAFKRGFDEGKRVCAESLRTAANQMASRQDKPGLFKLMRDIADTFSPERKGNGN